MRTPLSKPLCTQWPRLLQPFDESLYICRSSYGRLRYKGFTVVGAGIVRPAPAHYKHMAVVPQQPLVATAPLSLLDMLTYPLRTLHISNVSVCRVCM